MTIETTVHIWREGSAYVARALPIDVLSHGPTPETARAAVAEAVQGYIESARAHGTLEQLLEEAGYRLVRGRWVAPQWVGVEQQAIAI